MYDVSLIRPPALVAKWAHTTPTCPPIGLAYIAGSLVDAGRSVQIVDAVGEATDQYLKTDDPRFLSHGLSNNDVVSHISRDVKIIGVSAMFSHEWPLIKKLVLDIRERFPEALIVAGGEHVTAMPAHSLRSCSALDLVIVGEGEETIIELAEAWLDKKRSMHEIPGIVLWRDGEIHDTGPRARIRALDEIPSPVWELTPLENYLSAGHGFGVNRGRSMPMLATRGCPYQCTFCSNPLMWGTRWVARSPQAVFDEMMRFKRRYNIDNFDFYDLTAIVKRGWIEEFCKLIIKSGEKFTWQLPSGTRSEAIDDEIAEMLYETGCRNISYAPESGSPAVLVRIKKKINLDAMLQSMRGSVKAGINCKANIIIGFPGESHKEVLETLWFSVKMAWVGIHDMSISPFSPYPGSELFDQMVGTGEISEFDDTYFFSLAAYTDIMATTSCSEKIGDAALGRYRLGGMMLFYLAMFARRPWRLVISLRNIFSENQESRLEMSLRDLFVRLGFRHG